MNLGDPQFAGTAFSSGSENGFFLPIRNNEYPVCGNG